MVFCIECYKFDKGLNGKETFDLFKNYGLLEYLQDGYDMLHTQGKEWLINDIDDYLKIRGYEK